MSNGFGYFRIDITEDEDEVKDIAFERIVNPFSVYGDPVQHGGGFLGLEHLPCCHDDGQERFEDRYKDAEQVDWDASGYRGLPSPWIEGDEIMVAEFWHRKDATEDVIDLSDGTTVSLEWFERSQAWLMMQGIGAVNQRKRKTKKVTQYILTGCEVLETVEWPGRYIPIVPVYGDEINIEGKRYFRSLINPAKDAQRMHNYWRTTATELVALTPKTPFIGEEGSFVGTVKWGMANQVCARLSGI